MSDELDPTLRRYFAQHQQPLQDAQFVAQVSARLASGGLHSGALRSIVAAITFGLTTGISAPLRLRHAGLVALAGAALTIWALLQGA